MDQHGWCKLWRPLKTENLSTNQQTKIKITNQQYPTITCIYCKNANQWLSMTKQSAQSQSTYHKMDLKNGSMDLPISWVPNQHFKCRLPCNCTATGAECGLWKWGSYPPLRVYWWTHHWGIEGKKGSLGRLRVSNFGTEPFHPSWTWTRSLSLSRSSRTWDQCVDGDDTTLQSDIQAPLQRLRSNTRHSGLPQTTGFLWGKWSLGLWGSSTTGFGCTPFSDQPTSQFFSLQWPEVSKTTWTPGATMEPTQTKIATHSGRPPCKRSLSFQRWSHSAGRHGPGIWHMAMDSEHMGYPQCPMVFHNYDH